MSRITSPIAAVFLAELFFAIVAVAACDRRTEPTTSQPPVASMLERVAMEEVTIEAKPIAAADLRALEAIEYPKADGADHAQEGDRLMKDGRAGEAVFAYRKALSADNSADVWSKLGVAYLQGVDRARGFACLTEALRVDPARNDVRLTLARARLDDGDAAQARVVAEELLARGPADSDALAVLGRAFMGLAMWKEAVATFERVVVEEPTNSYARNNLGFAALQIGANDKALAALEEIPALQPQKPYMLNNLGVAYERMGRPADALAAFTRAAELSPKYVKASSNRERLQRALSVEEQIDAAESLLAMREGRDVGPAALLGEDPRSKGDPEMVGLADVELGADGGVFVEVVSDEIVIDQGGGGSIAGAAVMAPSMEPSLP